MSLFRCPGCRRYSTYNRYNQLTGVTYTTQHFYDSHERHAEPDEDTNFCTDCRQPEEDFDEIDSSHVERLQRKLGMSMEAIADYLNKYKL